MARSYEYKFVAVKLRGSWGKADPAYQNEVRDHAQQGWRLVQAFAPPVGPYGSSKQVDLIFERALG